MSELSYEWPETAGCQRSDNYYQQRHVHQHTCQAPGHEQQNS
ncbi:hypothetical protein [Klebsiella variicola]|nr:hypothetical protein [Klebsiella variicola]